MSVETATLFLKIGLFFFPISDVKNACSFSNLKHFFKHLYHNGVLAYFLILISFFISAGFITAQQNERELQFKVIHQKKKYDYTTNKKTRAAFTP